MQVAITSSLGRGRVLLPLACRLCSALPTHLATPSLGRGRVRMTAQLLGNKFPQFAGMLTLPARKTAETLSNLCRINPIFYSSYSPRNFSTSACIFSVSHTVS